MDQLGKQVNSAKGAKSEERQYGGGTRVYVYMYTFTLYIIHMQCIHTHQRHQSLQRPAADMQENGSTIFLFTSSPKVLFFHKA